MAANSRFAVATHIMVALAYTSQHGPDELRSAEGRVSSETIASSVNTNAVVVRRIVAELARAGLVKSHEGKHGGIELARKASRITLLDVFEALGEQPVFAFSTNKPNPKCPVSVRMVEVLTPVFAEVDGAVRERLRRIKLSALVAEV